MSPLLTRRALQRCGPVPCGCPVIERGSEPGEPATVQRMSADFQVRGKFEGSKSSPKSIFFDFNSSAIDADEDAKLAALAGTPLSTVELRGFVSEEGGTGQTALADARNHKVAERLEAISPATGSPTLTHDTTSSSGSIDYRSMRKVEILVAGAKSTTPDCSKGADIDCGPSPNPFTIGHDQAGKLLKEAITALGSPASAPALGPVTDLFKDPTNAPAVIAGLVAIQNHLPNMDPTIPLNDDKAPGHRCINPCEGDVLAYNAGTGPTARMTLGPRYMSSTDPVEQGLILIHEGSHGASGLNTGDHAYRWQRLLPFLALSEALDNADSYTELVARIHDPKAVSPRRVDTFAPAMSGPQQTAAERSLAWLEQFLVQGRLEVRDLYSAVQHARKDCAATPPSCKWRSNELFYRDNTMKDAAPLFGLTPPPAVPSAQSKWRIAAIFDRLFRLRRAVTSQNIKVDIGTTTVWDPGPGPNLRLAAAFFGLSPAAQVDALLVKAVGAASFIEGGRKAAYIALVRRMAARMGGP